MMYIFENCKHCKRIKNSTPRNLESKSGTRERETAWLRNSSGKGSTLCCDLLRWRGQLIITRSSLELHVVTANSFIDVALKGVLVKERNPDMILTLSNGFRPNYGCGHQSSQWRMSRLFPKSPPLWWSCHPAYARACWNQSEGPLHHHRRHLLPPSWPSWWDQCFPEQTAANGSIKMNIHIEDKNDA